jgi:hypothetical protein
VSGGAQAEPTRVDCVIEVAADDRERRESRERAAHTVGAINDAAWRIVPADPWAAAAIDIAHTIAAPFHNHQRRSIRLRTITSIL